MKKSLLILLSFFTITLFCQTAPTQKIKITKSHFVKVKTLRDLIPSLPKDCPVTGYQFSIDTPQLRKTITVKNNKISSDLKSIIKGMKAGQKFFIESIKSDCKTPFKKNHIFVVT